MSRGYGLLTEECTLPDLRKNVFNYKMDSWRNSSKEEEVETNEFIKDFSISKKSSYEIKQWFPTQRHSIVDFFNKQIYNNQILIYPDQKKDVRWDEGILPSEISHLKITIEKSKYILNYKSNWDQEGSPGYSEVTWRRAIDYLITIALVADNVFGIKIDEPRILHGPEGSIDIYWDGLNYNCLINIPADVNQKAYCYGEDKNGNGVESEFNPNSSELGAIVCLISLQLNHLLK